MFPLHLQKKLPLPKDDCFKKLGFLGFSQRSLPAQCFDVCYKFSSRGIVMWVIM